jgi:hypothetical protein
MNRFTAIIGLGLFAIPQSAPPHRIHAERVVAGVTYNSAGVS